MKRTRVRVCSDKFNIALKINGKKMRFKIVDKTFVIMLIIVLLFANILYMWGVYKQVNTDYNYNEIIRTQLSQIKPQEVIWNKKLRK